MSPSAALLLVLSAPLAAIFAVGPAPEVSLVLQVASAVALLIGGPLARRSRSALRAAIRTPTPGGSSPAGASSAA
jgi:hypothetical protein